jgi:Spy/CpxP family protein refolding chaperone
MRELMHRMHDRMQPRMDTLREELMATRIGLMELVREPMPDGRADSLLQEIGRIEQEMNRLAFEHARQLIESLPPEARERFLERLEQRGGPGDRPWPRHWGRRPGPHGPGRAHPGGM